MPEAAARARALKVAADGTIARHERTVPVETPVAFVYNGSTYAVMMASPVDLEAFALGFSLTEGIVASHAEITSLAIVAHGPGIELQMWLDDAKARRLAERRRHLAGPTGCGLCGIESLTEAVPGVARVGDGGRWTPGEIIEAMGGLSPLQALNRETRAVHAAAFSARGQGVVALAEDVGRHNALDKLVGKIATLGIDAARGIVLLTSRVSVEMVQKAAKAGAPMIVAVSAPTDLAIRTADAAGITLLAVARQDGFEVFTHPHRLGLDHIEGPAKIMVAVNAA